MRTTLIIALVLPLALLCFFWSGVGRAQDVGTAAAVVPAETDPADRGILQAFLEDNLSTAGRDVRITGFAGALSSRATLAQMTIADADGIWLTATGLALDWNRAALLSGRVEINRLTAETITITRGPGSDTGLPEAEARGFSLPDLPVSVAIGEISAAKVSLGAPLLGQPAVLSLTGSVALAGGEGSADIAVTRIDGVTGALRLSGAYGNATRRLRLDLSLDEQAGGIASTLVGLPGTPALALSVAGDGPIDDFAADLRLASDGADRLTGRITLTTVAPAGGDGQTGSDGTAPDAAAIPESRGQSEGASPSEGASQEGGGAPEAGAPQDADGGANSAPTRRFVLEVGGDIAPLFAPEYRDFFGTDITLSANGQRAGDGTTTLSDLRISGRAISLSGNLVLRPDGLPARAALAGQIRDPEGAPVLLPLPGDQSRIDAATISLAYDEQRAADGWQLRASLAGLVRPDFAADAVNLTGAGQIGGSPGATVPGTSATGGAATEGTSAPGTAAGIAEADSMATDGTQPGPGISGRLTFVAVGLRPASAALAAALGSEVAGSADIAFAPGTDLDVSALDIAGMDYRATASGRFGGLETGFALDGQAQVAARNLSRFSALAGRALSGAADITLSGRGSPLAGTFDVTADLVGTGLGLDQPQLDLMLAGTSRVSLSARRDTTGTDIRKLAVTAATLSVAAAGRLTNSGGSLDATLEFADLSVLGPGYGGHLSASGTLTRSATGLRIAARAEGRDLRSGVTDADRLLAGDSTVEIDAARDGETITITTARLTTPQLTFDASGSTSGAASGGPSDGAVGGSAGTVTTSIDATDPVPSGGIRMEARLANLGLLVPEFPGPVTLTGRLNDAPGGFGLRAALTGPGGTDAGVTGTVADGFRSADLTITGGAQAGLANVFVAPRSVQGPLRFDLAVRGPLQLASVSGRVATTGARIVDPTLGVALAEVTGDAVIDAGRAQLTLTARPSDGGSLQMAGPVNLQAPNDADLQIDLQAARLRDPRLYDTRLTGTVRVAGPLGGGARITGQIALSDTEVLVPSAGGTAAVSFPGLRHVNDPGPVRLTRGRAGLDASGAGSSGAAGAGRGAAAYPLDLSLSAPSRMFLRGRGLDAELGGALQLGGTTANVTAIGEFRLIRGRLDILGKRFTLDEGSIVLQGALVPTVRLAASSEADGITTTILIEGPITEPAITFSSSPDLPEEEVVSRLLFGRGLTTLSPLQAAQLASAVATLSGRGGEGLIARLRRQTGLDDLDVTTAEDGTTALRLGKYLSDNLYTDIQIGSDGTSAVTLNLDVSDSLTVRGTVGTEGSTGLGLFYERDY